MCNNHNIGQEKRCNKCGIVKPASDFNSGGKTLKNGQKSLMSICRDCHKEKEAERRARMSEEVKQRYREAHAKYRASDKYKQTVNKWALEQGLSQDIYWAICEDCGKSMLKKTIRLRPVCSKCQSLRRYYKYADPNRNAIGRDVSCIKCGDFFQTRGAMHKMCDKCSKENQKKYQKESRRKRRFIQGGDTHRHRAKRFGVFYDSSVRKEKVFKRDNYKCKCCGVKVQRKDIYADNAAELDHIVPMAKGGPHAWNNVQTLCRKCNGEKSDSFDGQLVMNL